MATRLNKYIADCGICSRRAADKLILDGQVKVNKKLVTELGTVIDEDNDTVYVDGKKLSLVRRLTYIMLYKPKGCICSVKDDKGRKTVMDYVDFGDKRLFPVGRLDYDTEGLVIITNDGDLSYNLTHPSKEIPKTYIVRIEGELTQDELGQLRNGVKLDDGYLTRGAKVKILEVEDKFTRIEMTIYEGKNRQIRRMFEAIGKTVVFLKRTQVAELRLGGLARGTWRFLTAKEVEMMKGLN